MLNVRERERVVVEEVRRGVVERAVLVLRDEVAIHFPVRVRELRAREDGLARLDVVRDDAALREGFDAVDEDGDGRLCRAELKNLFLRTCPKIGQRGAASVSYTHLTLPTKA